MLRALSDDQMLLSACVSASGTVNAGSEHSDSVFGTQKQWWF